MRVVLRGYALQHRASVITSSNVSNPLRNNRNTRQSSTMNDAINSVDPMDTEVLDGNESEHPKTTSEPSSSQQWPRLDQQKQKIRPPPKEPRPDHFLAIRLSHEPTVISTIKSIHNFILQHSPHLEKAFIDPISAHLTLGVLHLPTEESKHTAKAALLNAAAASALDTPCFVTLQGISNFRNQVVFLELAATAAEEMAEEEHDGGSGKGGKERVVELASAVRQHFQEQGLLVQANGAFVPHVTLAKLSKMQPWRGKGGHRGRGRGGKRQTSHWEHRYQERKKAQSIEDDEEGKVLRNQDELIGKEEAAAVDVDSTKLTIEISTVEFKNRKNLPRPTEKEQPLTIPFESYSALSNISTNAVEVCEIQLCAMEGRKPGEYYKVIASASLVTGSAVAGVADEVGTGAGEEEKEDASMAEGDI